MTAGDVRAQAEVECQPDFVTKLRLSWKDIPVGTMSLKVIHKDTLSLKDIPVGTLSSKDIP